MINQEKIYFGKNYQLIIQKEIGIAKIIDLINTIYKVSKCEENNTYLIEERSDNGKNELK